MLRQLALLHASCCAPPVASNACAGGGGHHASVPGMGQHLPTAPGSHCLEMMAEQGAIIHWCLLHTTSKLAAGYAAPAASRHAPASKDHSPHSPCKLTACSCTCVGRRVYCILYMRQQNGWQSVMFTEPVCMPAGLRHTLTQASVQHTSVQHTRA